MDTIVTPVTVITLDSTRIVHSIKTDLVARYFPPVVRLVQYDQSLPVIAVSLMQNGQTYTLPSGAAANIRVHKPDATYVYNPALGCDSTRKIVYFEVTQAMAAANGDGLAIVEIVVDGDIAGTSLITLHFEENPVPEDAIESSDEWETIYELGERIIASTVTPVSTAAGMTDHNVVYLYTGTESGWNQGHMYYYNGTTWVDAGIAVTDTTLSVAGLAADAKKTGDEIADLKDGLNNIGDYAKETIVKEIRYPLLPFEIGAINITTSGWTYTDNAKRIRTPYGKEIYLNVGDVISLTDYTNARFFLGVRQNDGTYLTASWKTTDFTVLYEGWYVILVARITNEVALTDVAELADLVRITRISTLQEVVQSDTKKIASIGTGMIPLSKNLTNAEVPFELGTITINDPPTDITYAASNRSVRILESVGGIPLKAGDTIGLTNYSAAKYELSYYADGTYVYLSTNVADKVVPVDGVYYIIIHELNNDIISDVSEYSSLFFVNRTTDISKTVDAMEDSLSYIQYPYDIYPIHGINHRGMQYEAPENTLPAFRLSVGAGYHFVETDVQFTSDNVPVLLHDPTLNRTARNTDGTALSETVYIKDITYAEALEYDFPVVNGVYNPNFAGTKIFKFEDFIIFCKRTELFPYLELKSETTYTQAQVNMLINILDQYKMLRNVSWISWADAFLEMIVKADKGARVGRIKNSKIDGASVNALNKFKTGFNRVFWSFSPYENDTWKLSEQSIINAKNAGQGLSIGVISTKAGMLNVLNHFENSGYISGCLSNERTNFAELVRSIALGEE